MKINSGWHRAVDFSANLKMSLSPQNFLNSFKAEIWNSKTWRKLVRGFNWVSCFESEDWTLEKAVAAFVFGGASLPLPPIYNTKNFSGSPSVHFDCACRCVLSFSSLWIGADIWIKLPTICKWSRFQSKAKISSISSHTYFHKITACIKINHIRWHNIWVLSSPDTISSKKSEDMQHFFSCCSLYTCM